MRPGCPAIPLFLLPSAGSSAAMYASWSRQAERWGVQPIAVELAGRGARLSERPFDDIECVLADLAALTPADGDWLVFGHSYGALLAAEWASRAGAAGRGPSLVIVSGAAPPWVLSTAALLDGPPHDVWARIGELGGLPDGFATNAAARRVLGPALSADVAAAAAYLPLAPSPLSCELVAIQGQDDPLVSVEQGSRWEQATSARFQHVLVDGGHFYRNGVDDLLPLVANLVTVTNTQPEDLQ